jgi:hypothetical protein
MQFKDPAVIMLRLPMTAPKGDQLFRNSTSVNTLQCQSHVQTSKNASPANPTFNHVLKAKGCVLLHSMSTDGKKNLPCQITTGNSL